VLYIIHDANIRQIIYIASDIFIICELFFAPFQKRLILNPFAHLFKDTDDICHRIASL